LLAYDDLAGLALAAGSDAAVVFGSGQVKMVPQGLKTWGVWIYIHLLCRAVYLQASDHGVFKAEAFNCFCSLLSSQRAKVLSLIQIWFFRAPRLQKPPY
jgi:hypothetical protein